jgi:hypothetical protein
MKASACEVCQTCTMTVAHMVGVSKHVLCNRRPHIACCATLHWNTHVMSHVL